MTATVETIADERWAATVAAYFRDRARPGARLCMPSGDTPTPFYEQAGDMTSLDGIELFLLDEFGGLAKGDPGRCLSMITRGLLSRVTGDLVVHSPDVDAADAGAAAAQYGQLIAEGGLDLAVVGLGANGHVGMNEPGSTMDMRTRVVDLDPMTTANAVHYGAMAPPTWGITVGLAELMAAREVWVLVTGSHKTDILNATIHGMVNEDVPASFLTTHSNCVFLVDESAGLGVPAS